MYIANRSRPNSIAKEDVHGCASHKTACLLTTANLKALCSCIQVSCSNRGPPCSRATWAAQSCSTLTSIAWLCSVRDCNHTSSSTIAIVLVTCTSRQSQNRHNSSHTGTGCEAPDQPHTWLDVLHAEHPCATVDPKPIFELRHKPHGCSCVSQLHEESNTWALSSAQ